MHEIASSYRKIIFLELLHEHDLVLKRTTDNNQLDKSKKKIYLYRFLNYTKYFEKTFFCVSRINNNFVNNFWQMLNA